MGKITVLIGALCGVFLLASGGLATAEIIIDDFDTGAQVLFTVSGTTTGYTSSASNAIGGTRDASVRLISGASASLIVTSSGSQELVVGNSGGSIGEHIVTYGFTGSSTPSAADNNWDFSGENAFEISVTFLDPGTGTGTGGTLVATVYDGSSGSNSYATNSLNWPSSKGKWIIPFGLFSGSPTWSAIDRIQFKFTAVNTAPDLNIDIIRAVPEPSTVLLLLSGGILCGVTAWRRRRRIS